MRAGEKGAATTGRNLVTLVAAARTLVARVMVQIARERHDELRLVLFDDALLEERQVLVRFLVAVLDVDPRRRSSAENHAVAGLHVLATHAAEKLELRLI